MGYILEVSITESNIVENVHPYFCQDDIKVVCCKFVVCGKGSTLSLIKTTIDTPETDSLTLTHKQTLSDAAAANPSLENVVTKEEIAQNEQFLLLPQCFQLYSANTLYFFEKFHTSVDMFSKLSAADLLYVGEG